MEKIYTDDFDCLGDNSDAGLTYKIKCPKCYDVVTVAENGWWNTDCECGYTWRMEIKFIGEK